MSKQTASTIRTVVGLIFAIAIGVGGWFAAPTVNDYLSSNVAALAQVTLSEMVMNIIITVVIFVIGMAIVVMLLSLILPGDKRTVSEKSLAAEHNAKFANRENRHRKRSKR